MGNGDLSEQRETNQTTMTHWTTTAREPRPSRTLEPVPPREWWSSALASLQEARRGGTSVILPFNRPEPRSPGGRRMTRRCHGERERSQMDQRKMRLMTHLITSRKFRQKRFFLVLSGWQKSIEN